MTEPLTITTSPREDRQLDLTIKLGPERTEEALHRAARQVAQKVNIPGFRRGKAPYVTVLRHFGREALLNEILDDLGQEVYQEALTTEKIEPFAQAQVHDIEVDPPTFKLVVPLQPEIDLDDYRSIRVDEPQVSVEDTDIEKVIADQRASRVTWLEIERPAAMGDTVTIDIHGHVGDDNIMDNHDWDLVLKEESGWLPGFAEAFVGMAAGEEKEFTLKYPEDSSSRYKGQEATFDATVKKVKARLEPELNDEFAKSLGEYADVEDLKTKLREQLLRQRTSEAESKFNEQALEAVIAKAHLAYPPVAIDETLEDMLEEVRRNLSRSGYSLEDFVRLQGMTLEQYREQLRPQAEKRLQGRLVLGKLVEAEQTEVTPEEIQAELDRMAPANEENAEAHQMRTILDTPAGQAMIRQDLLTSKTLARLREIVSGKAPAAEAPEAAEKPAGKKAAEADAPAEAAKPAGKKAKAAAAKAPAVSEDEVVNYESGTALPEAAADEEQTKEEEE